MLSIQKIVLSLALVAVASTHTMPLATADLTKFDAQYDGTTMYLLTSLAVLDQFVEAVDDAGLKKDFASTETKIKEMASAGTLTSAGYSCLVTKFYTKANKKYATFAEVAADVFSKSVADATDLITYAPTYWWDFTSVQVNVVAKTFDNKDLNTLVSTLDKDMEKAINGKSKPDAVFKILTTFNGKAAKLEPTFKAALDKRSADQSSAIITSFSANAGCDGTAAPTPTTAKPSATTAKPSATTAKPSATTDKPSATTDKPSATTEAPSKETVTSDKNETTTATETTTAPATSVKNDAKATTTAPPTKTSGASYVAGAASALVMAAVVVFTTVL